MPLEVGYWDSLVNAGEKQPVNLVGHLKALTATYHCLLC